MVALSTDDKSRCRWHLGYVLDGVPEGDSAVLEDRMANMRDNYERRKIKLLLDACDNAETRMRLDSQTVAPNRSELITGDINRSILTQTAETRRQRRQAYVQCCEDLAIHLAVANYNNAGVLPGRLHKVDSRRVGRALGPADTCISDKIYLSINFG